MCVILCCYDKYPTQKELEASELIDSHGAGVAWLDTVDGVKGVRWKKGLGVYKGKGDTDCVTDLLERIGPPSQKNQILIHFRNASQGGVSDALCHPFPLSKDASLALEGFCPAGVLAHNGTLSFWKKDLKDIAITAKGCLRLPDGAWSDSRSLAFLAANFGLGFLSVMDTVNKVAVLTPRGFQIWGDDWCTKGAGFMASNEHWIPAMKGKKEDKKGVGFQVVPATKVVVEEESGTGTEDEGVVATKADVQKLLLEMKGKTTLSGVEMLE